MGEIQSRFPGASLEASKVAGIHNPTDQAIAHLPPGLAREQGQRLHHRELSLARMDPPDRQQSKASNPSAVGPNRLECQPRARRAVRDHRLRRSLGEARQATAARE